VALAECAIADEERRRGAEVDLSAWASLPLRALLFGEAQGRVIASTPDPDALLAIAKRHGVPARRIGTVGESADDLVVTVGDRRIVAPLDRLAEAYHGAIPAIMNRSALAAPAEPAAAGA
jgi:phosphoribosylformylglycinamidine synthase